MIISYKYKYIYIDIPKTGCTAIQNYLLENDNTCEQGWIEIEGRRIKIDSHTKTSDIKEIMGDKFDDFTVFTFIRNPKSRSVSAYFFYRNGNMMRSNFFIRNVMAQLNVYLTKYFHLVYGQLLSLRNKLQSIFLMTMDRN